MVIAAFFFFLLFFDSDKNRKTDIVAIIVDLNQVTPNIVKANISWRRNLGEDLYINWNQNILDN